jgi:hypothetical protein
MEFESSTMIHGTLEKYWTCCITLPRMIEEEVAKLEIGYALVDAKNAYSLSIYNCSS